MRLLSLSCICSVLLTSSGFAQSRLPSSALPTDSILLALVDQLHQTTLDTSQIVLIGKINGRLSNINQAALALPWLQAAAQSAQRINKPLYWGRLYYQYGQYYHKISNYPLAYQAFNKAIPLLQRSGNTLEALKAMRYLGLAYGERREAVKQIEQLNKNLAYAEKIKNYRALANIYGFLHETHIEIGDTAKASMDLQSLLRLARTYHQPADFYIAYIAYYQLAEDYERKGNYTIALPYWQKALLVVRQAYQDKETSTDEYAMCIWHVANNLFHQNRLQEAERMLAKSSRERKRLGPSFSDLESLLLAQLRERQNRLDEAYRHGQQVITYARKRNPHVLMEGLKVMIRIQKKRGRFQEALTAFEELKVINDSLQHINTHKAVANLEARAELQKQTQNLAILKKNAAIQELELTRTRQQRLLYGGLMLTLLVLTLGGGVVARNAQRQARHLQELNGVKDKLFSVIGHDLRTPVLHLRASLNQLSRPTLEAARASQQLAQLSRSVNAIYSTLDNLLQWAALQQNLLITRPETVDLSETIDQVLALFEALIDQKQLVVLRDKGPLWARADAMQAQIMLRNVLHNAFKFTPVGGQIQISYASRGTESVVSIRDTGIGMSETKPSSAVPVAEQGTGLGLMVSREFVKLNQGKIVITSEVGQGTTVQLFL